ncbi:MAG TPA: hypothetical protein VF121_12980 [Thermoanaerobaculia bacterium]|nr:hypothetical protein [Thermoanaerobaculia bacterium]
MTDETPTAKPQIPEPQLPQIRAAHIADDGIGAVTWASVLGLPGYSPDDPPDTSGGSGGTKGALSVAGA